MFEATRGVCVAVMLSGCAPGAPSQMADPDCDEPHSTVPVEVTADPNVDIVIADRLHPELLDGNEVISWDGWLAHNARAGSFFCHRPERTALALEAAPGLHRLKVLIQVFGNPGGKYDQLRFDVKSERMVDVPDDGVVVLNLELSLDGTTVSNGGAELASPRLSYKEKVLPVVRRSGHVTTE